MADDELKPWQKKDYWVTIAYDENNPRRVLVASRRALRLFFGEDVRWDEEPDQQKKGPTDD